MFVYPDKQPAANIGIAASGAGRRNLRLQFANSRGFGGRNAVGLLVFNFIISFSIGL